MFTNAGDWTIICGQNTVILTYNWCLTKMKIRKSCLGMGMVNSVA